MTAQSVREYVVLGTRSLTRKEEARLCWEKTFSPLADTDTTIFRLELSPLSTGPEPEPEHST